MHSDPAGTLPADQRAEQRADRRADRRGGDRRRNDRRRGDDAAPGPDTRAADSGFSAHADGRDGSGTGGALARVLHIYTAARAAIGLALLLALVAANLTTGQRAEVVTTLCAVYAVLAFVIWLLPRFRTFTDPAPEGILGTSPKLFWVATIGIDVVTFIALNLVDRSTGFNFAALLALPVLMAGVLMPRMLALGVAAAASLALLFGAWNPSHGDADTTLALARAGLAGIGFFVITVLAGELAARLSREEAAARDSMELARRQAQLNRLVIQEMADGVLVVDRNLRVRAANPAARALLVAVGLAPNPPFDLRGPASWAEMVRHVDDALATRQWPEAGQEVALAFDDGHRRTLRLRVRFTRPAAMHELSLAEDPYAVLLLEDLRTAQARLQQEKLAAMGRVSAGIAHEIRNPLAAISQANALLLEDPLAPDQRQLAQMVADNVKRLQRIVDEVMELAPGGAATEAPPIDGAAVVSAAMADWARTMALALGPSSRLRTDLPAQPLDVRFDAEHLRRVLINLLDNADRHASAERGAIFLRLAARDPHSAVLQVISDGPLIAHEVERHLFEPFFSTRSRGSGLGLYICRELCERYGAHIEYRPHPGAERLRNEFLITMRRLTQPATQASQPLAT